MIEKSSKGHYATTKGGRRLSKKAKSRKAAIAQLQAVEASKAARSRGAGPPRHAEESAVRQIQKPVKTPRNLNIDDWVNHLKKKTKGKT